ncbi:carbonic anhydrase [Streptomyces paromomycinus]|uniref:Carbonic anhydrase n=1 Tax=Streptomyces paromomycinus TaxID=92743 RepID=A0A401VZ83_STREY|nr:carbonic anhydrase [Streptomyces paromomycinus]GCD42398.1 carbonic anhydrase [Streptomyces paromomycinus]
MHPDLTDGVRRFRRDVHPARAGLFERLATSHRPGALFIGCSDARVVPELLTQSGPGELFVIRTAGNLVPVYGPAPDAVSSSIEYALAVLGVRDVIVCGHSGCGAMTALATGEDLTELPALDGWLHTAGPAGPRTAGRDDGAEAAVTALVHDNVTVQLAHLATHPSVARALARDAVALHGWTHDIRTGAVDVLDPRSGTFSPLA